jgi:hypothetical protein
MVYLSLTFLQFGYASVTRKYQPQFKIRQIRTVPLVVLILIHELKIRG